MIYGSVQDLSSRRNGSERKKYYVKGLGWTETEPLVTRDENGERVVQTSGLVRTGTQGARGISGGKLASAYDYARDDTAGAIARWRETRGDAAARDAELMRLYNAYRARGEYRGTFGDFKLWWANRHSQMVNGALAWNGAMQGVPTADARGNEIARNARQGA